MSHFVRCDRCSIESAVMGTVTMPPGWLKVFSADLCERCCEVVRDFIRFRPSDAAALPVEPIPVEAQPAPEPSKDGDKLFETAPGENTDDECKPCTDVAADHNGTPGGNACAGNSDSPQPKVVEECNAEERARTRKTKRARMRGQSAILPDPRKPDTPPGAQP